MQINVDMIYPVGSIYMTMSTISPATLFGGTWSKIEGKFLLGTNDSYTLGSTGGEETHTLTINEMPKHSHNLSFDQTAGSNTNGLKTGVANVYGGIYNLISYAGGSQPHNNMPPYLAVNIWQRTA